MNLTELLAELSSNGVELQADGDRLRCRAPQGVLTEAMRQGMSLHKAEILALLRGASHSAGEQAPIPLVPRDKPMELSFAQEEIWLSGRLSPDSAARTIEAAFRLIGPLEVPALRRSLKELFARHDAFRTSFVETGGAARQIVAPAFDPDLPLIDVGPGEDALRQAVTAEARRPFNLAAAPLLRTALLRTGERDHVLHIVAHHIVFDVWSTWIFVRELFSIYEAALNDKQATLLPLPAQYADFADWQRRRHEDGEAGMAWWKKRLAGAPALLDLPADRPRRAVLDAPNDRLPFTIPSETVTKLRAIGQREGTTMFMNLLGALQAVLCRWSGQEDVVVGSPVSGRSRPEAEAMIGSFAYPLVFRTDFSEDPTLRELMARVKRTTLEAYQHQDVPFGKVIEAAAPRRSAAYTPIFQVMFTWPPPFDAIRAAGLTVTAIEELHGARVDYDLFMSLVESGNVLSGMLAYNPSLFEEGTVRRMLAAFRTTLETFAEDPDLRLSAIALPQLDACRRRRAVIDGKTIDLETLQAALLEDPSIEDAHVLARLADSGRIRLVAYVAGLGAGLIDAARARFADRCPQQTQPDAWTPIASMPLRPDGRVDEERLMRLPVVDEALCRDHENGTLVVVAQEHRPQTGTLHVHDVLPDWSLQSPNEGANAAASAAEAPVQPIGENASRPPAFVDGGPLVIPSNAPRTMTEALLRSAEKDSGLTIVDSSGAATYLSYASLLDDALRILAGLRAEGMSPAGRVLLQLESLNDHFAAFWACVLGGITPVIVAIAPSYDARNGIVNKLANTWELLGHPPIVTSAALAGAIGGLESLVPMPKLRLLQIERLRNHPAHTGVHESRPEDVVFLQLTSGSTGVPKCIQETHRGIIAHIHGSQQFNGYSAGDVSLNWLPVDHVVPMLTVHMKDVYMGCREIQVKSDWILSDALRWLDLIETHRVTHSWAPNFGFKMAADRLARNVDRRWDLSCVRRFMNAGEQVTLDVVRQFLSAVARFGVAETAMQPAFGMAEVCTCMTYHNEFHLNSGARWFEKSSLGSSLRPTAQTDKTAIAFVDLGPPIPGVQIRITDADNQIVPEGVIGRFQIRGESVTPGYLNNESANREAFAGNGWFNSGDLGFILDGRLALTGREKEMIVVRGANFYCYEIEDVVNGIEGVTPTFSAACAVDDPNTGTEGLAVFFVPAPQDRAADNTAIIREIQTRVTSSLGIHAAFVIPLARPDFPKTTSGKIQRSHLKKALEAGQFASIVREVDVALENSRTIPDWFYRTVWVRRELSAAPPSLVDTGVCLILAGMGGPGDNLLRKIREAGSRCVRVVPGEGFARSGNDEYQIDPGNASHYRMLVEAVRPDRVLHIWNEAAGLIYLAQALAPEPAARLLVIATNGVSDLLPAIVRTLAIEIPSLHCTHIEMPGTPGEAEAALVLRELQSSHKDREVALRSGKRFVRRLKKIEWPAERTRPQAIQAGGMYVISGGLGGIGVALSRMLLQRFGCRLLLLGRTRHESRLQELRNVATSPDHVRFESVDIADSQQVIDTTRRAQADWNYAIDGVFHLAGFLADKPLVEETRETFEESLRAKVLGAQSLHGLVSDRPDALFVSFSSVNGFFGGLRAGAYSAASRYLEAFAEWQRSAGFSRSYCLSWSFWDETGMSRGHIGRELAISRGYRPIPVEKGLISLMAALQLEGPHCVIGLDESRQFVRLYTQSADIACMQVAAYSTAANESLPTIEIRDRFEGRLSATIHRLDRLPLVEDGSVDRTALASLTNRVNGKAERIAPRTELETALATVWRELLGLAEVGVHENFFDLGGHSLLLLQLHNRMRKIAGRDVPMLELIRFPTIASLAESLDRTAASQTAVARGRGRAEARQDARDRLDQLRQVRRGQGKS